MPGELPLICRILDSINSAAAFIAMVGLLLSPELSLRLCATGTLASTLTLLAGGSQFVDGPPPSLTLSRSCSRAVDCTFEVVGATRHGTGVLTTWTLLLLVMLERQLVMLLSLLLLVLRPSEVGRFEVLSHGDTFDGERGLFLPPVLR